VFLFSSSDHNGNIVYAQLSFCPSKKRDPTDSFGDENEEPSLGTRTSVLCDKHACWIHWLVPHKQIQKWLQVHVLYSTSENVEMQTKFWKVLVDLFSTWIKIYGLKAKR